MSEVMLYARPLVRAKSVTQAVPGVYRELFGKQYFDCAPLRATLSVNACGDNFLRGRCLECLDCRTGKHHAGGVAGGVNP